jgi:AraC-like DNA-binding protein
MASRMSQFPSDGQAVGASPVEGVLLVARVERPEPGFRFEASSLPGHLVHVVARGRVRQECNGRAYELTPRCAIWYHEDELVRGTVLEPWTFYTVNFIAPGLPPPDFAERLFRPPWPATLRRAERLHEAWNDTAAPPEARALAVHAELHGLLALLRPSREPVRVDDRARLWWWLETGLRGRLRERLDLAALARIAGVSTATIDRSCRHAVGMSPMRRLKRLRLSLARGLLARPDLSIGAIAAQVGYGRIHEFSRDYRKQYGAPPSRDRRIHA